MATERGAKHALCFSLRNRVPRPGADQNEDCKQKIKETKDRNDSSHANMKVLKKGILSNDKNRVVLKDPLRAKDLKPQFFLHHSFRKA